MSKQVLYLGDGEITGAASYLAGVMSHNNIDFDYLPSDAAMSDSISNEDYRLIIISDYPASNFTEVQLKKLVQKISCGMGLAMFGGWESFVGIGGGYQLTKLAEVLPVDMLNKDDRRNHWSPCIVHKKQNHPIVDSLPLLEDLPVIGGFNEIHPKDNASTLLSIQRYKVNSNENGEMSFVRKSTHPLLVIGSHGEGNVACFASDVAPHWIGGFVDWGKDRIKATADGSQEIEVGNLYAEFFRNIINWTGQFTQ